MCNHLITVRGGGFAVKEVVNIFNHLTLIYMWAAHEQSLSIKTFVASDTSHQGYVLGLESFEAMLFQATVKGGAESLSGCCCFSTFPLLPLHSQPCWKVAH